MKRVRRQRSGFTLIELLIVIEVMMILVALAIPSMFASRRAANETSAIGSLRTIVGMENTYRSRYGIYGTLAQLKSTKLVDPSLGNASSAANAKSGYYFVIQSPTSSTYWVQGLASSAGAGTKQFYTDESAVMFSADNSGTSPTTDTHGLAPNATFMMIGN